MAITVIEFSDQAIYEKIAKYCVLENSTILEIGCGNGRISSLLASGAGSIIAIDPNKKQIEKAKNSVSGIDFRVGSGETLSFPDSCFDVILFTLSLHHQDSRKALEEAARVVKDDGKVLVIEPVIDGEIEQVFAFLHNENREKLEAQKSIANSKFRVVASEVFSAQWEFVDREDLITSIFQYYDEPFQADIAHKIIDFIGDKIHSRPIVLQDTMIIQSLRLYR